MVYTKTAVTPVEEKPASSQGAATLEMITRMVDEKMGKTAASPAAQQTVKAALPTFYTVDDAIALSGEKVRELYAENIAKTAPKALNYKNFVRAGNGFLFDDAGNRHIDFLSAIGASQLGYNNEFIWSNLEKCFRAQTYMVGAFAYHNIAAAFAHNMAMLSPGGKLTRIQTTGSGSEAVEMAIKTVKLANRSKPNKTRILACTNAYHGMTTGALSLMGNPELQRYQAPLMDCVDFVPYGDIQTVRTALTTGKYMGFFVEPIQGEGGMIVPPDGYLREVRALCDQTDTLLVCDEIQCGCGRSGKMWACEYENIVPDLITFAKGVCGTIIPFSGMMMTEELFNSAYESPETFEFAAGTYQLNDMACAAGIAVLQYIQENNLLEAARVKGEYILRKMGEMKAKYPHIVKDVRGRGMMMGIEFYTVPAELQSVIGDCYGTIIANRMVDVEHVQTLQCTNDLNSLHILPPLTISMEDIDLGLRGMENAIEFAAVLSDVVRKLPENMK